MGVELAGGGGNSTANQLAGMEKMRESPTGRARDSVDCLLAERESLPVSPGVVSTLPRRPGVYRVDCLAAAQQQTHDALVR